MHLESMLLRRGCRLPFGSSVLGCRREDEPPRVGGAEPVSMLNPAEHLVANNGEADLWLSRFPRIAQ